MSKRGLGKGLDALFGKTSPAEIITPHAGEVTDELEVTKLVPNPYQPRKNFEEDKMQELMASIKEHGVIQPLIVRKKDAIYEIVAGERRFRAASALGLKKVPVVLRDYDDGLMMEVAMIENIQRHDLNPLEEAEGIKMMMDKLGLTQAEAAKKLGRSRAAVANILRLLHLPAEVQNYVKTGQLSLGQVKPLMALEDEQQQLKLAETMLTNDWTVRTIEAAVKDLKEGKVLQLVKETVEVLQDEVASPADKMAEPVAKVKPELVHYEAFQEKLMQLLGTKVRVVPKNEVSGKIEIEYYAVEDLERIYEALEQHGHHSSASEATKKLKV